MVVGGGVVGVERALRWLMPLPRAVVSPLGSAFYKLKFFAAAG
jgi:hypothetical protein